MNIDDTIVMLDTCTKFHRSLFVSGWIYAQGEQLLSINFLEERTVFQVSRVGLFHGGVASLGADKGFDIQVVLSEDIYPTGALLVLAFKSRQIEISLSDLLAETQERQITPMTKTFFDMANGPDVETILDVGGRARSQVDRSLGFPGKSVTVLDVLPGDNVTIVGDAHDMSSILPPSCFDAFLSVSVFEHLLMPWKVALEINRVLKPGGFGLVHTHQTLGMHDMPWDFWRFSDAAWDAIFNRFTGFEIIDRALTHPSYILPFIYRDDKATAERALGFEGSSVMVRKIGPPRVAWDVKVGAIVPTIYPND